MTLSKIIEQLKAADQNKTGMFELGEDVMCALVDLLERRERDKQEPVAWADPQAFENFKSEGGKNAACTKELMWRDKNSGLVPLYADPPAPVVTSEPVRYMNRHTGACFTLDQQPDAATDAAVYVPPYAAPQSFGNSEQLNSPAVPDGWQLVPIEPTWDMLSADGCSKHHGGQECSHHENRKRIWRAMLSAAPKQEGE